MKFETHQINEVKIAEVISEDIIINSVDSAVNLLGNLYYQGFDKIIIHEKILTPDFFDLKNGMAGDILQKFSNYRMPLAIIGDFSKYTSKSVNAFINECNRGKQINFVNSLPEALKALSNN
ncbi:MAG: DUF4180 domain-containing protein [Bacteroidales bacterium]|nr:DUF4180 domain-containing protein [Bacteroidales bacterium]